MRTQISAAGSSRVSCCRTLPAVAVQSINTDIRAVGASLRAREQEELVERLEALEEALEQRKGERRFGS
jgi:hypothetical protein